MSPSLFGSWPALLVAMLVLLPLSGCGPGLGGTGTGEVPVPGAALPTGVSAASVCESPVGSALGCAGTTAADLGSGLDWVDMATGGQRRLKVQGNNSTLRDDCEGIRFDGTWGVSSSGQLRYWGDTLADGASTRNDASLALAAQPEGPLLAQRYDATGQATGPALVLRRAEAGDPAPAACSP